MEQKDQELIEKLTQAINRVYESPKRLFFRQFLLGLFSGLGATLGVTILLAILSFVLRWLGGIPVIGDWLGGIQANLSN